MRLLAVPPVILVSFIAMPVTSVYLMLPPQYVARSRTIMLFMHIHRIVSYPHSPLIGP